MALFNLILVQFVFFIKASFSFRLNKSLISSSTLCVLFFLNNVFLALKTIKFKENWYEICLKV